MGVKIAYLFVTYILWGSVFYTSINIPYGSMASAISADPDDRQSLSTFRTLGGTMAGVVIALLALILWFWYPLHKKQVDENVRALKEKHAREAN